MFLSVDQAAPAVLDHVFEFVAEMLHEALDRPCRRVTQGTDRVALDLVRDIDQKLLKRLVKATYKLADKVAAEHRLTVSHEHISGNTSALMAPRVQDTIEGAAKALGLGSHRMPTGAGHDAQVMARVADAGMIFVPCERGISHNEIENATPQDLAAGARVLTEVLAELANR